MCTEDSIKPHINSSVLARLLDSTSIDPFERPTFGKNWLLYIFVSTLSTSIHSIVTEAEAEEYSYSLDEPKEHEAGYDSFITGVCFATMANYLQIDSCDINEKSPRLRHILNRWGFSFLLETFFFCFNCTAEFIDSIYFRYGTYATIVN